MTTVGNEKQFSIQQFLVSFFFNLSKNYNYLCLTLFLVVYDNQPKKGIQLIIQHWIRILHMQFGWIHEFDKLVVKYATTLVMFETFRSASKLLNTFTGHIYWVWSIDYSVFDNDQLICSGSADKKVRVWDIDSNKQIQSFNGHSDFVYCVKFSQYYYHNNNRNVICSSSNDKTIRFWDIKSDQQFQIFNGHTKGVCCIEFSPFNNGRYLCSGSYDNNIRLWDIETSKSLYVFNGHEDCVRCVDISPLQYNNNNNNKGNNIGVIGGNGYTICSGSWDKTIRIWDIETAKQQTVFKKHDFVNCVKYGSNELGNIGCANTILSGSNHKSVCLWDIRSGEQIQIFNGHTGNVSCVEYAPFVINNNIFDCSSNVICSGSWDNTIRFWDIRSNKSELYVIKGEKEDNGIGCLAFIHLKKKEKSNENMSDVKLCYGSTNGFIRIWGKSLSSASN
ncbi:WD-40 repeat protein [Reticulomyxa filosa]|uniref:WD-40 repeat protein n=1 Tax=Reticulomyxa filosa TaxID=46433 RepID=X6NY91_RETFI|nr:WD-40 repeat protein [Reticulomyxa filosa]|eukprot:ETO31290.1 WD-40 repeat protein [Reticulomyxa filosa]